MKDIIWLNKTYINLMAFERSAIKVAGYQLDKVQRGISPSDWKPMPLIGLGVKEIRIHTGNEYRVIYCANFREKIYVLHCFQKKTQKTTKHDINTARQAYKKIGQLK